MKTFLEFIKEADVPTVTTDAISSTYGTVGKNAASKYKKKNKQEAPKPIKEADINAMGDSFVTPDEANLYVKRNNEVTLKVSKELKKLLKKD